MFFCPLVSGSSGNATVISHGKTTVLIDAGRSGCQIDETLRDAGVDPKQLTAIFVTHEHSDHVQGVGILSRRHHIPIYATEGTWAALDLRGGVGKIAADHRRCVAVKRSLDLGDLCVTPFTIPHAAAQPVGYRFLAGRDHVAVVATDIGYLSSSVESACVGAAVALLESNHDVDMLRNGPYPWDLQQRILGKNGHLCNEDAGQLASLMIRAGTRRLYLGHLSKDNNHPTVALHTVKKVLKENHVIAMNDCKISVAKRDLCSESFHDSF
ncbi:MAG: MBL fold metallo-hydrolase [Thermoguttaceae bacterium]|nr:MBL fold metallo-hydrolase [Thermoguttaceae bacterium]